jgi:hypothetical protein
MRYCNIGHIDDIRFRGIVNLYTINVANIANLYTIDVAIFNFGIPFHVSW